jgi:hypothetical protein
MRVSQRQLLAAIAVTSGVLFAVGSPANAEAPSADPIPPLVREQVDKQYENAERWIAYYPRVIVSGVCSKVKWGDIQAKCATFDQEVARPNNLPEIGDCDPCY